MNWKELSVLLFFIVNVIDCCRGVPNPYPIIDSDFQKVEMHQFG